MKSLQFGCATSVIDSTVLLGGPPANCEFGVLFRGRP